MYISSVALGNEISRSIVEVLEKASNFQNLKVIRNNNNIRAVLEMKEDSSLLHYG